MESQLLPVTRTMVPTLPFEKFSESSWECDVSYTWDYIHFSQFTFALSHLAKLDIKLCSLIVSHSHCINMFMLVTVLSHILSSCSVHFNITRFTPEPGCALYLTEKETESSKTYSPKVKDFNTFKHYHYTCPSYATYIF